MTNISGSNISIGGTGTGFFSLLDQAKAKVKSFALETNSSLVGGFRKADAELRMFRGGVTRLGDELLTLSKRAALVGTLPLMFAAGQSYRDFAQMQMLQRGVERYGETLKDVRELAKLPNIGVFDGAKSLISLKAMRMESDMAKRSIKAFANAITDAGGSAADLDPALVNLRQFMATKHINQVDLRQLANRIPQTMEAIRNAFGTTDTEELNKLGIDKFIEGFVSELEKIPPVAGGAQMSMDQFFDSLKFGTATLGEGIDNAFGISSAFAKMGGVIDNLVIRYRELSPEVQKSVIQLGGFVAVLPVLTAGIASAVKYLPMLATGLGMTWPIVAIVGTTAALAGLMGIMQVVNDESGRLAVKIEDLNSEISKSEAASKKIEPLLARYEDLKRKAAEGAEVQGDLKKVINEIASITPSVATGFDQFGNALDINAEKAKANNEEQKKLLATLRQMSAEAQKAQKALLENEKQKLLSSLNDRKVSEFVGDASGGAVLTRDLSEAEMSKRLTRVRQIESKLSEIDKSLGITKASEGTKTADAVFSRATASVEELEKHLESLEGQYKKLDRSTVGYRDTSASLVKEITATRAQIDALMSPISKNSGKVSVDDKIAFLSEKHDYKRLLKDRELVVKLHLEKLREMYSALNPTDFSFADKQAELGERIAATERIIASDKAKKVLEMRKELDVQKQLNKELRLAEGSILDKFSLDNVYRAEVGQSRTLAGSRLSMALMGRTDAFMREQRRSQAPGFLQNEYDLSAFNKISSFGVDSEVFSKLSAESKAFLDSLNTAELKEFFDTISEGSKESSETFSRAINSNTANLKSLQESLSDIMKRGLVEGFVTVGEGLANSISGVGMKAGHAFKMLMGNLLQEVGKTMIIYSGIMDKIKFALSTGGLGMWGGVAVGAAAVFAGQMLKNSVTKSQEKAASGMRRFATGGMVHRQMMAVVGDNQNSAYDPEVISPLSKLEQHIQNAVKSVGAGVNKIQVEVMGVIDNEVIRLANAKAGVRYNRLRGAL